MEGGRYLDNSDVSEEERERNETYSVPRLLNENLREFDHLGVIVELLGQIDHLVCRVLLIAVLPSC